MAKQNKEYVYVDCYQCDENGKSIESVYGSEKDYQFGCAFIRSLHGEKKKGDNDYDRVPCAGDMCPCIKGNTDVAEEAINLPLAKTCQINRLVTGTSDNRKLWYQHFQKP